MILGLNGSPVTLLAKSMSTGTSRRWVYRFVGVIQPDWHHPKVRAELDWNYRSCIRFSMACPQSFVFSANVLYDDLFYRWLFTCFLSRHGRFYFPVCAIIESGPASYRIGVLNVCPARDHLATDPVKFLIHFLLARIIRVCTRICPRMTLFLLLSLLLLSQHWRLRVVFRHSQSKVQTTPDFSVYSA